MTEAVTDNKKDNKKEEENQASPATVSGQQSLKEIEEMYRAGVHFGYSRSLRHPKMMQYFFGSRNGIEVFHLEKIYPLFKRAADFVKGLGAERAKILFVGTKPEAADMVEKAARVLGMPYVTERWLGGTLTNFEVLKKRIDFFKELKEKKALNDFSGLSKKEKGRLEKKLAKMEEHFGGLVDLTEIPRAIVVVDSGEEKIAVAEARQTNIPVIALLNNDCDPDLVDWPVCGNDTAAPSIQYFIDKMVEAYKSGAKNVKIEK